MTSRLVMRGFYAGFMWSSLLSWFSGKLALVKMHLQGTKQWHLVSVALVSTELCCVAHWIWSCLWADVGVGNNVAPLSHSQSRECPSTLHIHRRVNNLLYFVPGFLQIPAFTLCLMYLSARQHSTLVFYLKCMAGFQNLKLQTLGTCHSWTHVVPFGEGLVMLWLVPVHTVM